MQRAAIYARVSTADQDCRRQVEDCMRVAAARGLDVVLSVNEHKSGIKLNTATDTYKHVQTRKNTDKPQNRIIRSGVEGSRLRLRKRKPGSDVQRDRVLALAQAGRIDVVLVSELSRWSRSVPDLLGTLDQLAQWNVSLLCVSGLELDMGTPTGKMLATMLGAFAAFERDLIAERIRSALASKKAQGAVLGRPKGLRPSDKHRQVIQSMSSAGCPPGLIAKHLGIDARTVKSQLALAQTQIRATGS